LLLKNRGLSAQIITKSDIVVRDSDILKRMPSVVGITVTTQKDDLSLRLEPNAPLPGRRMDAIRALQREGIPVFVRLDPIIPGINDSEIEQLVSAVASAGAMHITSSSYKARPDSWKRLSQAFSEEAGALAGLFEGGSRIGNSRYLATEVRESMMLRVAEAASREGLTFSCCREGLAISEAGSCDGSHLLLDVNICGKHHGTM